MNKTSDSFEHSELISAYLDGEVTEEERAFVESTPTLLLEVEKLQKITEVTSSITPIDPVLREKHLREAISHFPNEATVVPFRQRKNTQRGLLLAAVAAALAFIVVPVINSQDNKSDNGEIFATGLVENSKTSSEAAQVDNDQISESQTLERSEPNVDSQSAVETPQDTADTQNNGTQPPKNSAEESPVATDDEEQAFAEEEEAEAGSAEEASEQIASAEFSEESTDADISLVFEEASTLDAFLEHVASVWGLHSDLFTSPLSNDSINNFRNSNPEFAVCWNPDNLLEIEGTTPLLLERTIIGDETSLVIIYEPIEPSLGPQISVYQISASCTLLFEGFIFNGAPSD